MAQGGRAKLGKGRGLRVFGELGFVDTRLLALALLRVRLAVARAGAVGSFKVNLARGTVWGRMGEIVAGSEASWRLAGLDIGRSLGHGAGRKGLTLACWGQGKRERERGRGEV